MASSVASSVMSAPATKALSPSPVRMAARTSSSSCTARKAWAEILHGGGVKRVEHLGAGDGEEGDLIAFFVVQVFKRLGNRHGSASCNAE